MKARVMVALCLAALMLGACSASGPSEASENREIVDQGIQDSQSACQTEPAPDECLQDPEKTSLDSESVSDPDEIEMPSSAPPKPAGEQESSQEPTEPSSPQATENPTVPEEQTPPPDTSAPEDNPTVDPDGSEPFPQPGPDNPPTSEPEQEAESDHETTESEPPAFDVQVWVDFAISYGQQIGLEYDASATDCWDAPITASGQSKFLERDITSRLNRYLDRGMTGFSVWAESRSDGKYNLYIGYR